MHSFWFFHKELGLFCIILICNDLIWFFMMNLLSFVLLFSAIPHFNFSEYILFVTPNFGFHDKFSLSCFLFWFIVPTFGFSMMNLVYFDVSLSEIPYFVLLMMNGVCFFLWNGSFWAL